MSEESGPKCQRCLQPLSGGGFCVACGFNNTEIQGKKLRTQQQADRRLERAKTLGGHFRVLRWFNFWRHSGF